MRSLATEPLGTKPYVFDFFSEFGTFFYLVRLDCDKTVKSILTSAEQRISTKHHFYNDILALKVNKSNIRLIFAPSF